MPGDAAGADLVTESPLELGLDGSGHGHGFRSLSLRACE